MHVAGQPFRAASPVWAIWQQAVPCQLESQVVCRSKPIKMYQCFGYHGVTCLFYNGTWQFGAHVCTYLVADLTLDSLSISCEQLHVVSSCCTLATLCSNWILFKLCYSTCENLMLWCVFNSGNSYEMLDESKITVQSHQDLKLGGTIVLPSGYV